MTIVTCTSCVVCNSDQLSLALPLKDHSISKEDFELYRCGNCGFLFTQNPPAEANIGPYYQSEDYISHSDTQEGIVNKLYHIVRNRMLAKKHGLINGLQKGKKLLDVGCGTGYFLNYMKERNYETLGVEVDDKAREYGKKKFGINILSLDDFKAGGAKGPFNVISLWHVLEHLYDPSSYMQRFKELLEDDGYLIIAVPNPSCYDAQHYKAYWAGYDVPRHLWHFTPETMEPFARNNGFEIVKMKRMPFDSFYNSMLSAKYKNGGSGLISGGFIGGIALLKSWFNIRRSSSLIYVMRKAS